MANYDVSIFIVTSGVGCVDYMEYDRRDDDDPVSGFVMVTNDELDNEYGRDNTIFIDKDWITSLRIVSNNPKWKTMIRTDDGFLVCAWQYGAQEIPGIDTLRPNITLYGDDPEEVRHTLDGYAQTLKIVDNRYFSEHYVPAVNIAYATKTYHDGRFYHGYLPAIGQLLYIAKNLGGISDAFETLTGKSMNISNYMHDNMFIRQMWSSTQYDSELAWMCERSTSFDFKHKECMIMPLYPIIL